MEAVKLAFGSAMGKERLEFRKLDDGALIKNIENMFVELFGKKKV